MASGKKKKGSIPWFRFRAGEADHLVGKFSSRGIKQLQVTLCGMEYHGSLGGHVLRPVKCEICAKILRRK